MKDAGALVEGDRGERCGRTDVDEQWIWLEVHHAADEDCEFESIGLSFCSQAHAGTFLQEQEIDWSQVPGYDSSGVRVDRSFMGCGLLAIVLSVIGMVALVRWIA